MIASDALEPRIPVLTHFRIKTRLQVQEKKSVKAGLPVRKNDDDDDDSYNGTIDAIQRIIKREGITGLYTGLPASLIGVAATNFSYFFFYSLVRTNYIKRFGSKISTIAELSLGAVAGALAQIFTIPVSVVATRQQTAKRSAKKSLFGTASEIISDDGITGLWRGLKPSLVLVINPSITYGMFSRIQRLLFGDEKLTPMRAFLVGALSKTLATVVTYPYIMAKVRLQAKYDDEEPAAQHAGAPLEKGPAPDVTKPISSTNPPYPRPHKHHKYNGAVDVLRKVYKEEGIRGWYNGMQAQITKAVLSQALLFMYKEQFTQWTILLLSLAAKVKEPVKAVATQAAASTVATLKPYAEATAERVRPSLDAASEKASNLASDAVNAAPDALNAAKDAYKNPGDIVQRAGNAAQDAYNNSGDIAQRAGNAAKDAYNNSGDLAQKASNAASDVASKVADRASKLVK